MLSRNILLLVVMLHVVFYVSAQAPSAVNNSAEANQNLIQDENRTIGQRNEVDNSDLPLGIGSEIGGKQYIIAIDSLVLSPQGSFMRATTTIEVPMTGDKLSFAATSIAITPGGIKSGSSARLELTSDIPIRLSDKIKMTVKGTQHKTFVDFDCNGFIGLGLQGEFEFCRDVLIPELPNGNVAPDPQRVKASFETYVSDFSNVLTKVSISPFQIPGLNGFGFYVQDAWVDQSDVANPLGILFPAEYQSPDLDPTNPNVWRGFFIKQVDVRLPKEFNAKANNQRRAIKGYNLIIDNMGFTGTIAGTNLIPMNEGQVSGWAFSLDSMAVNVVCNNITGAGFKGNINIPITKEDVLLNYTAIIAGNDQYLFNVRSRDTISVPLFGAKMTLLPSTSITIEKRNGGFIPTANLTGSMNFAVQMGNSNSSEFKGITFEQLIVSGEKPYIRAGTFSIVSTNSNMASFKVSISNIGVIVAENRLGIRFALAVNLMGTEENGFAAMADLTIFGKMEEHTDGKHKWSFERVDLNALRIDVDQGAYEIHGLLVIYRKDPVYGTGFSGSVMARFQPGIQVNANAQFGNKDGLRYWYVDAMVTIPSGVMIMSGVGLYGFGGGMYHHMKQRNVPAAIAANATAASSAVAGTITPPASGITYVPDSTIFLGLKATVIVATYPLSKTVNADVTLEATFLEGGGMGEIMFYGSGYFMTEITERSAQAPLYCTVYIGYDFQNKILHGAFDVFVNINNQVRGINANNHAGSMVMHFEPQTWYIYAGTPTQRIGVSLLGVNVGTYFMVGTEIPAMPAPPSNVSDILGGMDLDFMRDENALGNGSGFAFGASIDINTGKKKFLVFYGQFAAGIGFDIMLKNYGKDVICAGRNEPLGANGWYASGQIYAYVQGDIGISVDLAFIHGEFKILEIGAAAILQAKLPNPAFMKGTIGGYYAILGGKVKGNCRFTLTIGEECQIVGGSVVSSIAVINETSPNATIDGGASVFVNPQATFNIPVDKVMELEDLDGAVKAYRVKLGHFKLIANNAEIPGRAELNEAGDAVAFIANDILPPTTSVKALIRVYFEERKDGNWIPVEFKGVQIDEAKEFTFTTGTAPDVIPINNVAYSYPEINQNNFLKSEAGTGYITLIKGQPYLFEADSRWTTKVRFTDDAGAAIESALSYNASDKTIAYTIPAGLTNDVVYHYSIVNVPATVNAPVNSNITASTQDLSDDGSVTLERSSISGTSETVTEKVVLTYDLRTSKYNTFREKMNAFSASQGWLLPVDGYISVHEIGLTLTGEELFDLFDMYGTSNTTALVQFEADANNRWIKNEINPMMYAESPLGGTATITWRTATILGVPPLKGIVIRQQADQVQVTNGTAPANSGYAAVAYKLPYYMFNDYLDLQAQCSASLARNQQLSSKGYNIIFNPFPPIKTGKYAINMMYVLPGKTTPSSTYQLEINNQF